jgi:phosphate transport system substrate-binding protein
LLCVAFVAVLAAGCGKKGTDQGRPASQLTGTINIDGSSTVYPITEAVAEEFQKKYPGVKVNVGISGTGGGFKKFTVGETDINDASRPIKDSEKKVAQENNIEYLALPVAYDGISVVVNKDNNFVDSMTVAELKKLWEPNSTVKKWNQIRPQWPDLEVKLFGPGTDSGTFDYFTEAINGKEKASRSDFTASEDDNVLVQGVVGNKGSLGYFGYSYYAENKDKLKLVAIDDGSGKPVLPSEQTIRDGSYKPLSRPLFIYVSKKSLMRPEVREFVKFYMTEAEKLVKQAKYVPLTAEKYQENLKKIEEVK